MESTTYRTGVLVLCLSILTTVPGIAQSGEGELERCPEPVGTLAVVEPQSDVLYSLRRYNLNSPTSLIRMMVQQSNCFLVVERGVAMQNMMQERELAESGQLRQGENIGAGQMEAADFILTPHVIFSEGNSGGVGSAVSGLIGRRVRSVGRLAGGLKFKEAQTSMLISDARSGIQVAAAEGIAKKTDFNLGLLGWGGGTATSVNAYTNTNEGKVIAASFLDNFNNIIVSLRSNPNFRSPRAGSGQAGAPATAGSTFMEGDVLFPKIDNVPVLSAPSSGAAAAGSVKKSDELVFLGEERDGFVHVIGSEVEGWIKALLLEKQ